MAKKLTAHKAGKILEHGEVKGKPLTEAQKGLFGVIRGGNARKFSRMAKEVTGRG